MDTAAHSEQTSGVRRRIPWLVAVPLMAAGSSAARALAFVCVPSRDGETGHETTERLGAATQGFPWASLVGVVAALLLVGLLSHGVSLVVRRSSWTLSASAFLVLPPLAFIAQEIAERTLHSEAGVSRAQLAGILVGLLLQVPLGVVAFLVARAMLAVAARVVRALRAHPRPRAAAGMVRVLQDQTPRSRLTLLALGHPQRGPPPLHA